MSEGKRLVAVVEFCGPAELRDVESLETVIGQRWHYETELDLSQGHLTVWRMPRDHNSGTVLGCSCDGCADEDAEGVDE